VSLVYEGERLASLATPEGTIRYGWEDKGLQIMAINYSRMDDASLIAAVACGDDPDAKEAFCRRYDDLIWTVVRQEVARERRRQGSDGGIEADDVFVEVFEELWKKDKARIRALHHRLQKAASSNLTGTGENFLTTCNVLTDGSG
jgi:hypothetical protein